MLLTVVKCKYFTYIISSAAFFISSLISQTEDLMSFIILEPYFSYNAYIPIPAAAPNKYFMQLFIVLFTSLYDVVFQIPLLLLHDYSFLFVKLIFSINFSFKVVLLSAETSFLLASFNASISPNIIRLFLLLVTAV